MEAKQLLNNILDKKDLSQKEASFLLSEIIAGKLSNAQIAGVLTGLRTKGETVDEITGFIKTMRKHMVSIKSSGLVIDTCGTGGDGVGAFNISTCVAFVVAATGVKVAKHGNRAASSKCGSADVLEALGVNINLTPKQASEVLEKVGMVFLFAQLYHPAMKLIGPIRKELGVRTIFNFLGPFLNPAGVKRQLIGVPNAAIAKKLSYVAENLGYKHLLIVSSKDGMDEISISSDTQVFEIKDKNVSTKTVSPETFGLKRVPLGSIRGGDSSVNTKIIQDILDGKKGPKRDIVVLNSAHALYVSGKAKTVKEGMNIASKVIDNGSAKQTLMNLIEETKRYA